MTTYFMREVSGTDLPIVLCYFVSVHDFTKITIILVRLLRLLVCNLISLNPKDINI